VRFAGGWLFLVTAAVLGLAEGLHDLLDGGSEPSFARAGPILAYATFTWVVPALACLGAGVAASALLGLVGLRRRELLGVALGAGGFVALVPTLMGRDLPLVLGAGGAAFLLTRFLLWRLWQRRPMAWSVAALVLLTAFLMIAAWAVQRRVPRASPGESRGLRAIVLVADALCADALSAYGGTTPTPHIDSIGADGWVVPDAISTSSWTLPAVASLFSSRSPRWHGATTYHSILPGDLPLLAERFQEAGCTTAAVVANPLVDPARGFLRGFDLVRGDTHQVETSFFWVLRLDRWLRSRGLVSGRNAGRKFLLPMPSLDRGLRVRRTGYMEADEVNEAALRVLDEVGDGDFLLYLHYLDPHDPYLAHPTGLKAVEPAFEPRQREALKELYAGEVAFLDEQIGVLWNALERRGLLDDTLVLFTSDHGEEFLDHGGWMHGSSLHDELVHVPLLVHFPKDREVPPVPAEASLVDVAPTLLSLLGMPPLQGATGVDLSRGDRRGPRFADRTSDGTWLAAVRTTGRYWIATMTGEEHVVVRGFDRLSDPRQLQDLAPHAPEEARQMEALLRRYLEDARPTSERDLSPEAESRLRAMGYIK